MADEKLPQDDGWDDKPKPSDKVKVPSKGVARAASADDPILTSEEIEAIRAQARDEILKTRKSNAKKQFLEVEKSRLLREEGMTTGAGVRDQMVNITVDLAEYAASIVINMRPYWHGHTYTVPRHVAEQLREIMQRTHMHQNEVDGKDRRSFYQKARATSISPVHGIQNAPMAPDAAVR
jgi:hypothetical protein